MSEFVYGQVCVKDMKANVANDAVDSKNHKTIGTFDVGGLTVQPTKRFWKSLQTRFGFSGNIFRYFSHKEVFDRISACRNKDDVVRYCIESDGNGGGKLLGVTNPKAPVFKHDNLIELLEQTQCDKYAYADGRITSTHVPAVGSEALPINGDLFENRFVIETPIDGYGQPAIYLSMLRLVCTNGAVAYSKAFRSALPMGKTDEDMSWNLVRAMHGYNNEEGFGALRNRFESAQRSWASVREVTRLYHALRRLIGTGFLRGGADDGGNVGITKGGLLNQFHRMTGDLEHLYGMTGVTTMSTKRQRTLPVQCRVYDVLNFISEVATHHADAPAARGLNAMIGELVGDPGGYDLEGTADVYGDFSDFFVKDEATAQTLAAMQRKTSDY